ncbi:MAG: tRNA pseudouridine(55) synthase TruB, partial [Gemmatimonadota bacterium]
GPWVQRRRGTPTRDGRALRTRRVGHTGTLDPCATGLLILCADRATRLASLFHLLPKRYEAEIVLGSETDTDDRTGEPVLSSEAWRRLARADAERALLGLTGELLQAPPAFSAKKVAGRRAHRIARLGGDPGLAPAPVRVHGLTLVEWAPPRVRIDAWVSTGTYVRALARDLGRELGCGAHLGALRRTAIGPFKVEEALSAASIPESRDLRETEAWFTPLHALDWLPLRALDPEEVQAVSHGAAVTAGEVASPRRPGFPVGPEPSLPVALADGDGLVAVAERRGATLQPRTVIRAA